jgi:regulator of protease activity HflC (stomatin/prohibitin superfamily)
MFKGIFAGVIAASVLILFIMAANIVGPGQRGIVTRLGAIQQEVLGEGFHLVNPFTEDVRRVDVKVSKEEVKTESSSKDTQQVFMTVAVNFHPDPTKVNKLWQDVGEDYVSKIIDPAMQGAVKATTAKYDAPDLITKRDQVAKEIKDSLQEHLTKYHIIVDEFNITNFNWSNEYAKAIEAKQTAIQLADKAKNDLERFKFEAEQAVATAKGQADSLALLRVSATPETIRIKELDNQKLAIEKWDGKLSQVSGGANTIIDLTRK